MICCVCMYVRTKAAKALTVIQGYAVCEDHAVYVAQGVDWYHVMKAAKEAERRK